MNDIISTIIYSFMLIKEIYQKKVKTISADLRLDEVIAEMLHEHFNGFVVCDKKERVVGVLSLQDIAGAVVPDQFKSNINFASAMYKKGFFHEQCKAVKHMSVKDVMRKNFVSVDLETNIMSVLADFLLNDLYIVPVIRKEKLIGIVTRTEIKKALGCGMGIECPE